MKKEEHQFKLAKIAIKRFFTVLVLLAALWMVFKHNPTKLVTSINLKEQSIDINWRVCKRDTGEVEIQLW